MTISVEIHPMCLNLSASRNITGREVIEMIAKKARIYSNGRKIPKHSIIKYQAGFNPHLTVDFGKNYSCCLEVQPPVTICPFVIEPLVPIDIYGNIETQVPVIETTSPIFPPSPQFPGHKGTNTVIINSNKETKVGTQVQTINTTLNIVGLNNTRFTVDVPRNSTVLELKQTILTQKRTDIQVDHQVLKLEGETISDFVFISEFDSRGKTLHLSEASNLPTVNYMVTIFEAEFNIKTNFFVKSTETVGDLKYKWFKKRNGGKLIQIELQTRLNVPLADTVVLSSIPAPDLKELILINTEKERMEKEQVSTLKLKIITVEGKQFVLTCGLNNTVMELKTLVSGETGIGADEQYLIYLGQMMEDLAILGDLGVKDGDKVQLIKKIQSK